MSEKEFKSWKDVYADSDGKSLRMLVDLIEVSEKARPFFTALVSEDEATAKAAMAAAKEVFGEDE